MFKVKVLNQAVLEEVLEMGTVIEAIEQVYTLKAENKTTKVAKAMFGDLKRIISQKFRK